MIPPKQLWDNYFSISWICDWDRWPKNKRRRNGSFLVVFRSRNWLIGTLPMALMDQWVSWRVQPFTTTISYTQPWNKKTEITIEDVWHQQRPFTVMIVKPRSNSGKMAVRMDVLPPAHLHSKSMIDLPLVDLRLTRPPDSMRLKPLKDDKSSSSSYNGQTSPKPTKKVDPFDFEGRSERMKAMVKNFCSQETGLFIDEINMQQYTIDSGETVTDATVQELCTIRPTVTRLDLTDCHEITDVSLWAIARHCVNIRSLVLSGCHQISHVGLRSLSLRLLEVPPPPPSHSSPSFHYAIFSHPYNSMCSTNTYPTIIPYLCSSASHSTTSPWPPSC